MELKAKYRDPRNAVITGGAYKMRTNNSHPGVKYKKKPKLAPRRRK